MIGIKQNDIALVVITVSLVIASLFIDDIPTLTAFALAQFVICVIAGRNTIAFHNALYFIVVYCLFAFYFGQLFVYYYIVKSSSLPFVVIERLSEVNLLECTRYALISFSVFFLGMVTFSGSQPYVVCSNRCMDFSSDDLNACRTIGVVFFVATIVPALTYEYGILAASFSHGYAAGRVMADVSGITDDLARLCRISILLMMVGFKDRKYVSKLILILFVSFLLLKLIVYGERGYALIDMLIFIWSYKYFVNQEKKTPIVKIVVGIIVLVFILGFVGEMRAEGVTNISTKDASEVLQNNFFVRQFVEFGWTLLSLGYTMRIVPMYHPYTYGKTFLYSLMEMLPGGGGAAAQMTSSTGVIFSVQGHCALGGSFISDTYLNFGYFGFFLMFFFGFFMAGLLNKIHQHASMLLNPIYAICWLSLYSCLIWLVRGTFLNVPRTIEFTILPVLLLYYFLKKRKQC